MAPYENRKETEKTMSEEEQAILALIQYQMEWINTKFHSLWIHAHPKKVRNSICDNGTIYISHEFEIVGFSISLYYILVRLLVICVSLSLPQTSEHTHVVTKPIILRCHVKRKTFYSTGWRVNIGKRIRSLLCSFISRFK